MNETDDLIMESIQENTPPLQFDFSNALRMLKDGYKVARLGWNGKGMFAYYVPANKYPASRNTLNTVKGLFEDDLVPYRAYLALKTAQNDIATWNPSTSDILAEDWITVE